MKRVKDHKSVFRPFLVRNFGETAGKRLQFQHCDATIKSKHYFHTDTADAAYLDFQFNGLIYYQIPKIHAFNITYLQIKAGN